jgi:spore coat polysaccharide biosynthesis protein SpsF
MVENKKIHFRFANETDADLFYKWANDQVVRQNSFNPSKLIYEDHVQWFKQKLGSGKCFFYLFFDENNTPIGQVRIDSGNDETVIGISVDEYFRGRSYGKQMLIQATDDFLLKNPSSVITAYIKVENAASLTVFKKAGFTNEEPVIEKGHRSYKLSKKNI